MCDSASRECEECQGKEYHFRCCNEGQNLSAMPMVPTAAELLSIPSIRPPLVAQPLSPKQIPADMAVETWC